MNSMTTLALPKPRLAEGRFGSLTCFTDESLFQATGVRIAFTERTGGASASPFDSLNLGLHVHDDPEAVRANRRALMDALDVAGAVLVQPRQVHGTDVSACITLPQARALASTEFASDGVVVGCQDVAALLCFADCVPVIGVSPTGAFFVAHAGWRGVVGRIVERAVEELCRVGSSDAEELNIYLGPFIHACHFEVGDDVRGRFESEFGESCVADDCHVDLGAALRVSLAGAGIAPDRIADVDVCTVCDGGRRFYSYRASGGVCGRHGAFAVKHAADCS